MPNVVARKLRFYWIVGFAGLPQKRREGAELFGVDSLTNVEAVDPQFRQLANGLCRPSLIVPVERNGIEVDVAANNVDAQLRTELQMLSHDLVELVQLLADHRVSGRISAQQPPEA